MSRPVLLTSRPARAVSVFAFAAASCGAAGFMLAAAATPALDTAPAVASLMTPGVLAALDMRGLGSTAAMSLPAVASVCHAFVAATGVFAAAVLGLGSAAATGFAAMSLPAVTSVCHAIVAATSVLAAAGFALMRAAATVVAAPLVVGPRRRAGREQDPERERNRQSRHLPWCVHTIAP